MAKPNPVTPDHPEPRKGSQKAGLTPEQVAKKVTDQRPSPVGQPTKVEITMRLVLPRVVLERTISCMRRSRHLPRQLAGDSTVFIGSLLSGEQGPVERLGGAHADATEGQDPVRQPTEARRRRCRLDERLRVPAPASPRPWWHFTPRIVPHHRDALVPIEAPFIVWADAHAVRLSGAAV